MSDKTETIDAPGGEVSPARANFIAALKRKLAERGISPNAWPHYLRQIEIARHASRRKTVPVAGASRSGHG